MGLLAADLPDHRMVPGREGTVRFVPEDGGPVLEVSQRVERRFLGRTLIARFHTTFPAPRWGSGRLRVEHTGRLKRDGMSVGVVEGPEKMEALARRLTSDPAFSTAVLALDFTRFDLSLDGVQCAAEVELMGASLVAIAFPPIRSYVHLHPDQREALIGSLTALRRLTAE